MTVRVPRERTEGDRAPTGPNRRGPIVRLASAAITLTVLFATPVIAAGHIAGADGAGIVVIVGFAGWLLARDPEVWR